MTVASHIRTLARHNLSRSHDTRKHMIHGQTGGRATLDFQLHMAACHLIERQGAAQSCMHSQTFVPQMAIIEASCV